MSGRSLILVGGGGHCRSVIDVIEAGGAWTIAGILDRAELVGTEVLGHRIIGADGMIGELAAQGHHFLITAGQIKDAGLRVRLHDLVLKAGGTLATVVSPLARVARSATLGAGCVVGHGAVVNSAARVGSNGIINTAAVVEHDVMVGAHAHISTGAILNGGCSVGERSFVGSRAVVLPAVRIGAGCIIGAGAVVLKDVRDGATAVGQPARER